MTVNIYIYMNYTLNHDENNENNESSIFLKSKKAPYLYESPFPPPFFFKKKR